MKCKNCDCELNEKNPPMAMLDFACADDEDIKYYCSAECLIEWIMTFSIIRFGCEEAKNILSNCEIMRGFSLK